MGQSAVFHVEFLMTADELAVQFELDDSDRLVHLLSKVFLGCIIIRSSLHLKHTARIILVYFHRKRCKRQKIDPISILQDILISIAETVSEDCCDAGLLSNSCSHQDCIMISPLNVQRMGLHQTVHNEMRSRSTVKNISQDMKVIDNKTLDSLKKNKNITMLTLEKLCRILDCTPNDIVKFK